MAQASNGKADAQAAYEVGTVVKPWEFELNELGPEDVEIKITHSGICHSDIHTINGDWGPQSGNWPIVPGHEILGIVTQVGANVQRVKVGDRAGVGPQAFSCKSCKSCEDHRENYCTDASKSVFTYAGKLPNGYITKGGYATYNRTDQRFVVKIPDGLPSAPAAPLLCAGITTYAPIKYAGIKEGTRVGVVGIGGLGHLAIQFAAALGAHVTAISTSSSKRAEAESFGAKGFVDTSDAASFGANASAFDVIVNTSSGNLNWSAYFSLLANHGRWIQLGAPSQPIQVPSFQLISKNIVITGTLIGSPSEIEEMLQFAADKNVRPLIEVVGFSEVNQAIERVLANQARYRIVIHVDPAFE